MSRLTVHGGSKLHTFTRFERDARKLCDRVAGVRCQAGETRLLDILARVLATDGVSTVVYVGDVFEESERQARKLAAALAGRNIRLIVLQDAERHGSARGGHLRRNDGAYGRRVLPFDASALPKLRDLFAAVAVLAVGGRDDAGGEARDDARRAAAARTPERMKSRDNRTVGNAVAAGCGLRAAIVRFLVKLAFFSGMLTFAGLIAYWLPDAPSNPDTITALLLLAGGSCICIMLFGGMYGLFLTVVTAGHWPRWD